MIKSLDRSRFYIYNLAGLYFEYSSFPENICSLRCIYSYGEPKQSKEICLLRKASYIISHREDIFDSMAEAVKTKEISRSDTIIVGDVVSLHHHFEAELIYDFELVGL
ncbi:MAG: hypothetical protein AAF849_12390 [Bacteroidota bacterium]